MSSSTTEERVAGKTAAEDTSTTVKKSDAAATTKQQLTSTVIIFNDDDEFVRVDDDGTFDLEITPQGDITGKHAHPTSNGVHGSLQNGVITLTSDDGVREHTGFLIGKTFIGLRIPLTEALTDQEEGVWVGTKKP